MGWWTRYFRTADVIEIVQGLWMGAELRGRGARTLAAAGVTYLVDMRRGTTWVTKWPSDAVPTHSLAMVEYEVPGIDELRLVSSEVAGLIRHGEVVYVHCRARIERAPLVAYAVLMQMGLSLPDVYRVVSLCVAAMSDEQRTALEQLKGTIGPQTGITMTPT